MLTIDRLYNNSQILRKNRLLTVYSREVKQTKGRMKHVAV